jgi:hypothetical protein
MLQPSGGNALILISKTLWKINGLELFTPIASNKNGSKSNKNLETMTRINKAQLPR